MTTITSIVEQRLLEPLSRRPCTLLGIGPMSRACVEAALEVGNTRDVPLMLIASRRQIDAAALGGGYVENWSTEELAEFVHRRDKRGHIFLSRDHGGPWQGNAESLTDMSLHDAMERAKISYEADITSGFSVIHVDPSLGAAAVSRSDILWRVAELYEFCWSVARRAGRDIVFEIGTEEQMSTSGSLDELDEMLVQVRDFCTRGGLPLPVFVVAQTGTKVVERRNVGSMASPYRVDGELPAEIHVIRLLGRHGVHLKQHNTDFLSDDVLSWIPRLGVHSANVAPEFGQIETLSIIDTCRAHGHRDLADRFLGIAHESGKWKKWMLPDSRMTDFDRGVIAGHYVYATPAGREVIASMEAGLARRGIDLAERRRAAVRAGIERYLTNFRLI
jgi:hypothetical protein